jgi:2,3-bisphosphoglycerate-independent phosphoglycerate mutase
MKDERRQILDMLAEGKITVDEAEKLLSAISSDEPEQAGKQGFKKEPKYLRVLVEPGPGNEEGDKVNIRVPMKLIRAGLKWAAFIPKNVQGKVDDALHEQGINMDLASIKPEDLEDIVTNLNDLTVDVEGKEKVRIFCE